MYRKKSRGWYKHKDFILIDLACLFMALILAYLIRNGSVRNLFTLGIYRNVMIFVILVDLFLIILFESYKGVLRRGRYQELRSVIRQMILIELASGLYLFTVSGGHAFSRIILYLMGIFYVLLSYCTRIIWKKRLLHKMAEGGEHSLYIVTNYDLASKVIQNVKEHNYNRYNINGLILIDKDMTGKEIAGVPVVADLNNASSFICQQWVDEVLINIDEEYPSGTDRRVAGNGNAGSCKPGKSQKYSRTETICGGNWRIYSSDNHHELCHRQTGTCQKSIGYSGGTGGLLPDRNHFYFHSTGYLHQFSGSDFLLTDKDWKKRKAI